MSDWAAVPQARNATSTTAANGFADQDPNELTTDVVTGSMSLPVTTAGRVGVCQRGRKRVEDDERRDAEQGDPDRARDVTRGASRLLRGADAGVEADEHPAGDGERGEHAGARRATGEILGTERVGEDRDVLGAEDEQQRQADADRGKDLGGDPCPDHAAEDGDTLRADRRAHEDEDHPHHHDRIRRRRDANEDQRPGSTEVRDSRVGGAVGADRHPAAHPAVAGTDEATCPLIGASRDRELRRELRIDDEQQALAHECDRQHPHPGRSRDRHADEHDGIEPDDGRDRRDPEGGVVEDVEPAGELLGIAELM